MKLLSECGAHVCFSSDTIKQLKKNRMKINHGEPFGDITKKDEKTIPDQ